MNDSDFDALLNTIAKQAKANNDKFPVEPGPSHESPVRGGTKVPCTPEAVEFWQACLRTSFLPPSQHIRQMMADYRKEAVEGLSLLGAAGPLVVLQHQFAAIRYRLSRAVQPTGMPLDPLAAAVGAVRLQDPLCSRLAAAHLRDVISASKSAGDDLILGRLRDLSKAPLGKHRNYKVWMVINELYQSQMYQPDGSPNQGLTFRDPTTRDVKKYVADRPDETQWGDLRSLDDSGWAVLFQESGARFVLGIGVRGKRSDRLR